MLHYVSFGAFAYRYDMARFAGQPWNSAAAEVVVEEFFGIGEEHRIVDGKHATRRIGDVFIIVCDVLQAYRPRISLSLNLRARAFPESLLRRYA